MEPEDIHQEQSPFNAGDEQNTVPASLLVSVLSRLGLESGNRDAYPLSGTHEDELLTVLQTATWEARIAAVWELEKLGTQAPLEALRETARSDEDVSVRAAAVRVLASLGKYVLLPDEAFLTALHDPDWQVREAAALALADLAEQAPVEALLTTAQDKQEDALVRDAARLALEQLSDSMKVLPTYRQRAGENELQKENLSHDEDELPLLPVGSIRSRNALQWPLPTKRRRIAHIAESGLAVLLVASILIAWFVIAQRFHPSPRQTATSPAQHQPAILFTYQSPVIYPAFWVAGGEHLAFIRNGVHIAVWDAATRKLSPTIITLPGADNEGGGNIGLSLDGTRFVSSIYDATHQQGLVQVWDTLTGRTILTYSAPLQGQSSGMTTALSADSKHLAVAGYDNRIRIWDTVTGKLLLTCEPSSVSLLNLPVTNLSWSPNGIRIFALTEQGTVQIWDATTGHKLMTYQDTKARLLTWSPDGQRLLSENRDGTLAVFDSITHHVLWSTNHSTLVTGARWTLDGTGIIGYGSSDLLVLNATTGTPILTIPLPREGVNMAFSPDDKRLLSIQEDKIVVWDVHTGRKLLTYSTPAHSADALAWSPDGKRIALGNSDGVVQIWNAATGKSLYTYKYTGDSSNGAAFVDSIIWSPDSNLIAVIHGVAYAQGQEQEVQILQAS